jgi:hypothetical protein
MPPMDEGNLPDNLLNCRYSNCSAVSLPSIEGMLPVSELNCKSIIRKDVTLPIDSGIDELNLLCRTYNSSNLHIELIDDGIDDVSLFENSTKAFKFVRHPMLLGIV